MNGAERTDQAKFMDPKAGQGHGDHQAGPGHAYLPMQRPAFAARQLHRAQTRGQKRRTRVQLNNPWRRDEWSK